MADVPSFQIEHTGGQRKVGSTDANQKIGSKPSVPVPGAGVWRDYYVEVNGKEPADCHMVIQSKVPVNFGMAVTAAQNVLCRGNCADPTIKECKLDSLTNGLPAGLAMIETCTCLLKPVRVAGRGRTKSQAE
jgi:hypothetical protein